MVFLLKVESKKWFRWVTRNFNNDGMVNAVDLCVNYLTKHFLTNMLQICYQLLARRCAGLRVRAFCKSKKPFHILGHFGCAVFFIEPALWFSASVLDLACQRVSNSPATAFHAREVSVVHLYLLSERLIKTGNRSCRVLRLVLGDEFRK